MGNRRCGGGGIYPLPIYQIIHLYESDEELDSSLRLFLKHAFAADLKVVCITSAASAKLISQPATPGKEHVFGQHVANGSLVLEQWRKIRSKGITPAKSLERFLGRENRKGTRADPGSLCVVIDLKSLKRTSRDRSLSKTILSALAAIADSGKYFLISLIDKTAFDSEFILEFASVTPSICTNGDIGHLEKLCAQFFKTLKEIPSRGRTGTSALRQYLEGALHSMNSGLTVLDAEGNIIYINPIARKILDVGDDVMGNPIESISPDLSVFRHIALPGGDGNRIKLKLAGGRTIPIGYNTNVLRDKGGRHLGTIAIFKDLTEKLACEREARERQKLETVSRISSGIAHEVKNPLFAISSGVQLVMNDIDSEDSKFKILEIVYKETMRVAQLINMLIKYTSKEVLLLGAEHVGDLISESILRKRDIVNSRKLVVKTLIDENIPAVELDRGKIVDVFSNILQNAIEASEEGQTIEIRAAFQEDSRITIEFEDSGVGIPMEYIDNVFAPFYTTKRGNMGMGLALCSKTLMEHEGDIRIESESGRGTTVYVDLPVSSDLRRLPGIDGNRR